VASRVKLESGHRVEGAGCKIAQQAAEAVDRTGPPGAVSLLATRSAGRGSPFTSIGSIKYDGRASLPTPCGPRSPLPPGTQICDSLSLVCCQRLLSAGTSARNDKFVINTPPTLYKVRQKTALPIHSAEQIGPHDLIVVSIGGIDKCVDPSQMRGLLR
jgi:hypothetical protein